MLAVMISLSSAAIINLGLPGSLGGGLISSPLRLTELICRLFEFLGSNRIGSILSIVC